MRTCVIDGCGRPHKARGWCGLHYKRWQTTGDPLATNYREGSVSKFDRAGITYRQLDYWTTCGYLKCLVANPGSGMPRTWSDDEWEIAARIKALLDLGVTLAAAARIARHKKAASVVALLSEAVSA